MLRRARGVLGCWQRSAAAAADRRLHAVLDRVREPKRRNSRADWTRLGPPFFCFLFAIMGALRARGEGGHGQEAGQGQLPCAEQGLPPFYYPEEGPVTEFEIRLACPTTWDAEKLAG